MTLIIKKTSGLNQKSVYGSLNLQNSLQNFFFKRVFVELSYFLLFFCIPYVVYQLIFQIKKIAYTFLELEV